MNNPFLKSKPQIKGFDTYSDYIRSLIRITEVGDSFIVHLHGHTADTARATIMHCGPQANMKFKTKTDDSGNLWAMRVK